jgi:hypothetical protein
LMLLYRLKPISPPLASIPYCDDNGIEGSKGEIPDARKPAVQFNLVDWIEITAPSAGCFQILGLGNAQRAILDDFRNPWPTWAASEVKCVKRSKWPRCTMQAARCIRSFLRDATRVMAS